jgi:galactokinase
MERWVASLSQGRLHPVLQRCYGDEAAAWQGHYLEALRSFATHFGGHGEVAIARCPGQMNIMGMHIDYGGMPSLRLAVRGADTLTVARRAPDDRVRMCNLLRSPGEPEDKFAPLDFHLRDVLPRENVGTRQALMDYAGRICAERQARTGSARVDDWAILPQGHLVFLESYFRGRRPIGGMDALVWSNVSPSGGMSSSSALVVSTAFAALGVNGLVPYVDMPEEDLVDGIGTSEWIRGTRGGTADHGGMILGRAGALVSVGVFPAGSQGRAALPSEYLALIVDSGVPRVYDEAVKEETVIAYPLGTFVVRDLLLPGLAAEPGFEQLRADFRERLVLVRDLTEDNLGVGLPQIYQLLAGVPTQTTLAQVEAWARRVGAGPAYAAMHQRDIAGKFQRIGPDYPIALRRRFAFGLAEQDRVRWMLEYMNQGRMDTALELVRISHDGDLDQEVEEAELQRLLAAARRGEQRARLCFLPGGYGRMTPAYDRVVRSINAFLLERGGPTAGSVQRLGAGWGGNVGGLVRREFVAGPLRPGFDHLLCDELHLPVRLDSCIATPGEGACLLDAPKD